MSEANASFNPPEQPDQSPGQSASLDSSPAAERQVSQLPEDAVWGDVWAEPSHSQLDSSQPNPLNANQIFDISTLDNGAFEDASSGSDLDVSEQSVSPDVSSTSRSALVAWPQESLDPALDPTALDSTELPNLADLITLIQELNQCNGALMDRVSQLEEDLEFSQNALQAEVGRTQDKAGYPLTDLQSASNAQDWATVQEQITTLFNQLEFAHQTNQRQQILIETLTGQLENGQEHVAQLEREAALLQQRYNEQAQLLSKSEGTCRDLQARLQRQQRYTLQFKAALEKSLEMPTPQYEMGIVAETPEVPVALATTSFLPKAQRIQPWSAHTQMAALKSPWMKLQHVKTEAAEPSQAELPPQPSSVHPLTSSPAPAAQLDLPSFGSPLGAANEDAFSAADLSLADPVLEEQVHRLTNDPALRQHLDAAVKPLAEMLAEALLADQSASAEPDVPEAIIQESSSSADELLASTMADAEDALWQDLARLIDVSAEDVVKASLSGDLAAFESIKFDELQPPAPQSPQRPKLSRQPQTPPEAAAVPDAIQDASTVAPLLRRIGHPGANPTAAEPPTTPAPTRSQPTQETQIVQEEPNLTHSSWPSPVVYPLRSTKKRQSLAMVDLPTFPKGES